MRYKVQLILFAALSFFTFSQGVQAQKNVYVGANAGLSMGIADFSSFGADKFRPGWTAGIYGGYRLNSIWSFELTGAWGQQFMAERSCCFDKDYFLGTDGKRYKFIPEGTAGEYYNNLKSRIFVQRYGVQANMNVLGFFKATKDSPWRAEISPALYAAGTNTDILRKSDNSIFAENMSSWHLGLGVNAQASYAVSETLSVGLYAGMTHFTGKPIDSMPLLHVTNCVIDAGVKITVNLGRKKNTTSKPVVAVDPVPASVPAPTPVVVESEPVVVEDTESETAVAEPAPIVEPDIVVEPISEPIVQSEHVAEMPSKYPVIYFSHSSFWIEPSERAKVKEIADMMKADKSIRILIKAWGDPTGGEEANASISLMRAERVKMVLGQWLIPADRIEVEGCGLKHDAPNDSEARVAVITEIKY